MLNTTKTLQQFLTSTVFRVYINFYWIFNTNTNHAYQVLNLLNGNLQKFYIIVFFSDHPVCCFYSNSFRTMSHGWGAIKNDIFLMFNIIFLNKSQVYSFYYSKLLYKLGENSEKIFQPSQGTGHGYIFGKDCSNFENLIKSIVLRFIVLSHLFNNFFKKKSFAGLRKELSNVYGYFLSYP